MKRIDLSAHSSNYVTALLTVHAFGPDPKKVSDNILHKKPMPDSTEQDHSYIYVGDVNGITSHSDAMTYCRTPYLSDM